MLLRSTTASIHRGASGFVCPAAARTSLRASDGPRQVPPLSLRLGHTRLCFCFVRSHRDRLSYSRVSRSALPDRTTATMASADFWRFFLTPLDVSSPQANRQISPGITHSPSRLCWSDLRRSLPCKNRASQRFAGSPRCPASIRFLFVKPAFCLPLPPDSASRPTPLPFG